MPGIFLDINKTDFFLSFKKLIELGDADYQMGLVQQVLSALDGTGDLRLANPVWAAWGMPQGDFQISMSIVYLSFTLLLPPILGYIIFPILVVHHQSYQTNFIESIEAGYRTPLDPPSLPITFLWQWRKGLFSYIPNSAWLRSFSTSSRTTGSRGCSCFVF